MFKKLGKNKLFLALALVVVVVAVVVYRMTLKENFFESTHGGAGGMRTVYTNRYCGDTSGITGCSDMVHFSLLDNMKDYIEYVKKRQNDCSQQGGVVQLDEGFKKKEDLKRTIPLNWSPYGMTKTHQDDIKRAHEKIDASLIYFPKLNCKCEDDMDWSGPKGERCDDIINGRNMNVKLKKCGTYGKKRGKFYERSSPISTVYNENCKKTCNTLQSNKNPGFCS